MLDKNKISLAIAPIAWTNDDMPDLGKENTFEQCISEMALAGFTGSEIGCKYPKDIPTLKKTLELRGIQICNCWFSTFLLTKPYEEVLKDFTEQLDFLKAMGAKTIGVSEQSYSIQGKMDQPVFEGKHIMNDEEWELFCQGLNKLGKAASEKGMNLTFHHHMGTVVQTREEIDRMMESTNPEYVHLLFDSGHLSAAGEDPLDVLKTYGSRIKHIHLKDVRLSILQEVKEKRLSFLQGVRLGLFTVPGDGNVDFTPLFSQLDENRYEGWVVVEAEQDPSKADPFEYAQKARTYIHQKTGL
jgi:inosose dehydratase